MEGSRKEGCFPSKGGASPIHIPREQVKVAGDRNTRWSSSWASLQQDRQGYNATLLPPEAARNNMEK